MSYTEYLAEHLYAPFLRKVNHLKSIKEISARRKKLCSLLSYGQFRILKDRCTPRYFMLLNDKSLFPNFEDKLFFFKYAIKRFDLDIIRELWSIEFNIHEVRFKNGKSALHYFAEKYGSPEFLGLKRKHLKRIEWFLKTPQKNYCDDHGYTYLHGACLVGNVAAVNLFLSQGVDVNRDTYTCSALHIAVWQRRKTVVKVLLKHGANPNQRDHKQSTPLHALSWPRCGRPVDKLVKMLVDNGADIEARNCHGDTALQLAVSRLDTELTRALLKHGASLRSLNANRMFNLDFTSRELKCYPLTLNIIEMMELLQSAGHKMDFLSRFRIMKCWTRVRGKYDVDQMIAKDTGIEEKDDRIIIWIEKIKYIYKNFGFYIQQEAIEHMHQRVKKLRQGMFLTGRHDPTTYTINIWRKEVEKLKDIRISEDVSLYQLCQMSYSKGYSIITNSKNRSVPSLYSLENTPVNLIVKRHLANILIRPQLVLFAADLFMTDHCNLNLPYIPCRRIAEYMSDEDLLRLVVQTNEKDLKRQLSVRCSKRLRVQTDYPLADENMKKNKL